jgi:hypothetical protein
MQMPARILVPLRNHDRMTDILPYLVFVARPGMEIIFLVQSDDNRYPWWLEHDSAIERSLSIGTLEKALAQQRRVLAAEERVAAARNIVDGKGVEIRIEFYSGSLKKVTASYRAENDEMTILVSSKPRHLQRFLTTLRQLFGRPTPQPVSAMLLLQPNRHF